MKEIAVEFRLSLYNSLKVLKETGKTKVELVLNNQDGLIYIKKTLAYSTVEVFKGLKEVESENIPKVYEVLEYKDDLIIIEEFINGTNLQDVLDREGKLSEDKVREYTLAICRALSKLHFGEKPIIHRDIKPSNIIIDTKGVLKLIDFDASRVYKKEETRDTVILGTEGYLPPEQLGYCQTDGRSDIYSLGVLMNVMVTGKHPREEMHRGEFSEIIDRCLKLAPELRYDSVEVIIRLLEVPKYRPKKDIKENISKEMKKQVQNTKKPYKENRLPGFRSGKTLNMVLGGLWYFFMLFGQTVYVDGFTKMEFFENLGVGLTLFLLTLLFGNYRNIQGVLPIVRGNKKAGLILYTIVIFFSCGLLLEVGKM